MASATSVQDPSLPAAPEAMQKWLRQEDWEALTRAWQEAEAQAISWAEGTDSEEVKMEELWQEASQASFQPSMSVSSLPPLSQTSSKKRRRKRSQWDEAFHLLGKDTGKPPSMRRYFDSLPSENTVPLRIRMEGDPKKAALGRGAGFDPPENLKGRRSWVEAHHMTVSPDNPSLHPHLRSYFDRRGLESCYKSRPIIDLTSKKLRPRTPQRPSTREKIMRFRSVSEPSLTKVSLMSELSDQVEAGGIEARHIGTTNWGKRCLHYGTADFKIKPKREDGRPEKIPWVADHHTSVGTDNVILHPALRHYFDQDGLESSFRNRGIHWGRKQKEPTFYEGIGGQKQRASLDSSSSWNSVPSSLFDKLSYSSLVDDGEGGLPGVRKSSQGGQVSGGYSNA